MLDSLSVISNFYSERFNCSYFYFVLRGAPNEATFQIIGHLSFIVFASPSMSLLYRGVDYYCYSFRFWTIVSTCLRTLVRGS